MEKIYSFVERHAERYLTKRKAIKEAGRGEKKTVLKEIWSWLDAFIFAIIAVLLINQYLFQLFVIPSPSMVDTINVGDRVVVSKLSYGLELYPAGTKIFTDSRDVSRDDIITFYNPEYESKGPVFDILSQIVYMGTLSLVNIDKNAYGTPAERLFVKRAAGLGGDQLWFENGDVMIEPAGYSSAVSETAFRQENGLSLQPARSVGKDYYPGLQAWARLYALQEAGVTTAPSHLLEDYKNADGTQLYDMYEFSKHMTQYRSLINPSDMGARSQWARYRAGIYVPEGYVLPLGDNRDNSRDGRYFGPVPESDINGRVLFRFWPINRAGGLD